MSLSTSTTEPVPYSLCPAMREAHGAASAQPLLSTTRDALGQQPDSAQPRIINAKSCVSIFTDGTRGSQKPNPVFPRGRNGSCLDAKSLQSRLTFFNPMDCSPTRLLCPWDFPGKDTGVGCHALLQEIFLTQGLNLELLCHLH